MEVLEEGDEYLSAEEIHSRVNELSGGGIGLATVYRTLQLLEEHGFLHRLESGEGRSRYKLAPGEEERNRKVFICRRCRRSFPGGSLSPDERKVFAPSEEEMKSRYGFQVQSRVMQFFGLCAECAGETGNSQKEEQE
jgi:Fur family ferric uptake transcriptional regulator